MLRLKQVVGVNLIVFFVLLKADVCFYYIMRNIGSETSFYSNF